MALLHNQVFIQGIGFVAFVIAVSVYQLNSRKSILNWGVVSGSLWAIHFFLLGAYTGSALNFFGAIKAYTFNRFRYRSWSGFLFWGFVSLFAAVTAVTWQGPISLLPAIGTISGAFASWRPTAKSIRLLALISPPSWFAYNFISHSYAGMVTEVFILASIFIGMYRLDRKSPAGGMLYKGVVFDIDGTAVPAGGIKASRRLKRAVKTAAKNNVHVSAASGRSYEYAKPIFKNLKLTTPSIFMSGAAIVDPRTEEIVWSKALSQDQMPRLLELLSDYGDSVKFSIDPVKQSVSASDDLLTLPVYIIWVNEVPPDEAQTLAEAVSELADTVAYNTPSWEPGLIDVHITHKEATKKHAVEVLIRKLGLKPAEVIGIGDSGNDVPMFDAVGYKVAMADGAEELKLLADEIAPPVTEDGLAQTIEKYAFDQKAVVQSRF